MHRIFLWYSNERRLWVIFFVTQHIIWFIASVERETKNKECQALIDYVYIANHVVGFCLCFWNMIISPYHVIRIQQSRRQFLMRLFKHRYPYYKSVLVCYKSLSILIIFFHIIIILLFIKVRLYSIP